MEATQNIAHIQLSHWYPCANRMTMMSWYRYWYNLFCDDTSCWPRYCGGLDPPVLSTAWWGVAKTILNIAWKLIVNSTVVVHYFTEVTYYKVNCSLVCFCIAVTADSGAAGANQCSREDWQDRPSRLSVGIQKIIIESKSAHPYNQNLQQSNSVFLKLCRRPILENFVPYMA